MDSFCSMMKRNYDDGTLPSDDPGHLQRYVNAYAGRHNQRPSDTEVQMRIMAQGTVGKRLRYRDLAVGCKCKDPASAVAT